MDCKIKAKILPITTWLVGFAFLLFLSASSFAQEASTAAVAGDASNGKKLFTGETRFEKGGPACISCHGAGMGYVDGGSYARDLTGANVDLINDSWISNARASGSWDAAAGTIIAMQPIYSKWPVTAKEAADVKAFIIQQKAKGGPSQATVTGVFFIISLGGTILLLIIFSIGWRKRYRKRNKGTAHEDLWRNYQSAKGGQ